MYALAQAQFSAMTGVQVAVRACSCVSQAWISAGDSLPGVLGDRVWRPCPIHPWRPGMGV